MSEVAVTPEERGERFAQLIRSARLRVGVSQDRLAQETGISRSQLIRWESGRSERPDPETVRAVCLFLGLDPREAVVALGYLTPSEAFADRARHLDADVEQVIFQLKDPSIPDEDKRAWVRYLAYLHQQHASGIRRIAFGVDVVSYSSLAVPQQHDVQRRLATMVGEVLALIDLQPSVVDRQAAGDGMLVVLPEFADPPRVVNALLRGWNAALRRDNAARPDNGIRLRLSVVQGAFARAAIGFSGNTIIRAGRLLDSSAIRGAVSANPAAELVALVGDELRPSLVDIDEFTRVEVSVKTHREFAWLWAGPRPYEGDFA